MKLSVVLLILLGWTAAYAQLSPATPAGPENPYKSKLPKPVSGTADSLIINGGFDHFTSANDGGSGSIDWVHTNELSGTYTAGFAAFSTAGSRWAFGKGGIAFRTQERVTIQGQASIGGGHTSGTNFTYQIYDGGLIYKTSSRLYLKFNDEYLQIGATRENLLKPGVMLIPTKRFAADLTYAHSATGNLNTRFFLGRFDFKTRPINFLGGFGIGHTTPEILNVSVGSLSVNQHFSEGFFGFGVPLSGAELTVVADFPNLQAIHKQTLTLSLKVPLRRQ